jgi:ABC-2 type transport system permease protein
VTLLALSFRSMLRGRRLIGVMMLPLVVAAVAIGLLVTAGVKDRTFAYEVLVGNLLLPLVVALVALVLGVNAFGDERDEGTLGLLLATTLARPRIVLAKYLAALTVVWLACLPATLACMALGTATRLEMGTISWSLLVSSGLAAAAYVALFTLLSLLLSRAVLVGLAYLVLWEGLLAGTAPAFRNLSVGAYANRIAGAPWVDAPFPMADTSLAVAVLTLLGVTCVAVGAAAVRLPRTHV